MPSHVLNYKTPLQVLASHIPLPSILMLPPKVFGSVAYVHLPKIHRTKLDPCAIKYVFLGYENQQKGYRCYDPTTRRLYTMMDVTFLESEMFFISQDTQSFLQGETRNEDQNWVSKNWINWDSEGHRDLEQVAEYEKDSEQQGDPEQVVQYEKDSEQQRDPEQVVEYEKDSEQ